MLVSVPLKTTSFSLLELGLVPSQVCHVLTDGLIHSHGHAVVPTNQVQPMFIGLFQSFRLFRIQLFLADPDKTYDLCYKIMAKTRLISIESKPKKIVVVVVVVIGVVHMVIVFVIPFC